MIGKAWRGHLAYLAMSVFVVWHTIAMVLAPAPDNSVSSSGLRTIFQPYLNLLRLDNPWDFFAPSVGKGSQLRYVVEDADGKKHSFVSTDELSWFHPNYFWFRSWYYAIVESPDELGDAFAAYACRKHAALRPVSISLLNVQEGDFWADEHLSGKHPMDAEFVTVNTLKRVKCPSE